MNFHQSRKPLDTNKLTLPSISMMDDFLPSRSWAPPISPSPNTSIKSLPTPPQADHSWKSPPYASRNELSRDSSYIKPSTPLFSNTSPIIPHKSPQYHSNTNAGSFSYNNGTYTSNRVENDIEEVIHQCNTLSYNMSNHKDRFITSDSEYNNQDLNSSKPWMDDMIGKANQVLNALLRLRKHQMASEQLHHREHHQHHQSNPSLSEHHHTYTWSTGSTSPSSTPASANLNNTTKSRKRGKRPAFQGRCHSCNISSTPEWRRGPDGARTLCNACGLHYAKLARKQQENRGMSSHILGTSPRQQLLSPLPIRNMSLDRSSPTG